MGDESTGVEDVFALVANDIRFSIVRTLWDLSREGKTPVSFSTLNDHVGVSDSGQFNYHLDTLVPRFVREVEGGYELTYVGERIVAAAASGLYTETEAVSVDRVPAGECPECGGDLEATYENGYMVVECADCGETVTRYGAPPILAADYDDDDLPEVFARYVRAEVRQMDRGFCPRCNGRMTAAFDADGDDYLVEYTCQGCGMRAQALVAHAVADHPALVSLLHDHGIDYRYRPVWDVEVLRDPAITVLQEDPLRVSITFEIDDDALTLTLDEDLNVVEYERR